MKKALPPIIYKYFRLDEHFLQHLIKNEFWFSKAKDFNDPYDCNICLTKKTPETERKFTYQAYNRIGILKKFGLKENKVLDRITRRIKTVGICCFSEEPTSLLMWSHYGDSHKGICVGYSSKTIIESFRHTYNVEYGDKFPEINFNNSLTNIPLEILTHKSKAWKYEREIRIFHPPGIHSFEKSAIREIIFGLNTPVSQIRDIMAIVFRFDYKFASIKKVIISDNEYKIKFKRLAPAAEIPAEIEVNEKKKVKGSIGKKVNGFLSV